MTEVVVSPLDGTPFLRSVHEREKEATSKIRVVLTEGRRQLWMAQPPALLSPILNPLRQYILDPTLAIGSILLPTVIPFKAIDVIFAEGLKIAVVLPIRLVYGNTHNYGRETNLAPGESEQMLMNAAENAILRPPTRLSLIQPATDRYSQMQGAVSFICSVIGDVAGLFTSPNKLKQWFDTLTQLSAYLEMSGIGDELEEALKKPFYHGRLLDNFKILNDCQELLDKDRFKRAEIKIEKDGDPTAPANEQLKDEIVQGRWFMRFATAAYGTEMIRSALDREVDHAQLEEFVNAVAHHTRIDPSDVRWSFISDSIDGEHILNHFVAVDHKSESIVLAIRGTLSISETLVDLKGMSNDYCSGFAHQGIAEMAESIWKESGERISKLFEEDELKSYGFVITGHSLGAGTACLLNIKCHVEDLFGKRRIRCYAFAPPPTFYLPDIDIPEMGRIDNAIQNCVAYINDNDTVPFLSIAAIRRLTNLLDAVDNQTEKLQVWRRWRIFNEYEAVPKNIVDAVAKASKHRSSFVDGECDMSIPSRVIVWCRTGTTSSEPPVTAYRCDSRKVAEGTVFLCTDMFLDHIPDRYETSLDLVRIEN